MHRIVLVPLKSCNSVDFSEKKSCCFLEMPSTLRYRRRKEEEKKGRKEKEKEKGKKNRKRVFLTKNAHTASQGEGPAAGEAPEGGRFRSGAEVWRAAEKIYTT